MQQIWNPLEGGQTYGSYVWVGEQGTSAPKTGAQDQMWGSRGI